MLAALATAAALAHAAAAPESPAGGRVVDLSLAADEAVPRLSVARAAVTTVTFLDADGAPWPISTLHVSGRRPDGGARAQPPHVATLRADARQPAVDTSTRARRARSSSRAGDPPAYVFRVTNRLRFGSERR